MIDLQGASVFGNQLLLGSALIITNAVFHVSGLVWLASLLRRVGASARIAESTRGMAYPIGIAVFGVIGIHTVSAWAWAAVYYLLGEFTDFGTALYFSIVTATTLGYGDVTLTERWRLLASFEAMGGLILFGVSTAFLIAVVRRAFEEP